MPMEAGRQLARIGDDDPVWFCSALVNSDTLTVYYGIKQSQFTKLTPEPRASDSEESNEVFDRAIRGWLL